MFVVGPQTPDTLSDIDLAKELMFDIKFYSFLCGECFFFFGVEFESVGEYDQYAGHDHGAPDHGDDGDDVAQVGEDADVAVSYCGCCY